VKPGFAKQLADARRKADEILDRARREVADLFTGLQDAAPRGKAGIDMNVKEPSPKDVHRLATSRGKGPQDAHAPVLSAIGKTAKDVAREVGWDEALYSRARKGKQPIPEAWALAVQEATRSKAHAEGIEPTGAFWPAGVRVVKK
jgi:hypothetical protein